MPLMLGALVLGLAFIAAAASAPTTSATDPPPGDNEFTGTTTDYVPYTPGNPGNGSPIAPPPPEPRKQYEGIPVHPPGHIVQGILTDDEEFFASMSDPALPNPWTICPQTPGPGC